MTALKIVYLTIIAILHWVKCESNEDHRIVGGYDAEDGQFPYQVSLRKSKKHFCGGSILSDNFILTAAHCIQNQDASLITVVTGTNRLDEGGDTYDALKLISHPLYVSFTITNDIGLIKLKEPIKFNDKIKPIKLPTVNTTEDKELVLSGWGTTGYPGKIPNKLQTIKLLSINNLRCMTEHPMGGILPTNICTFTKEGEGACHGDSGGPLVDGDEQVGVVSWGLPCAKGKPDVFTRVYSYLPWLKAQTEEQ